MFLKKSGTRNAYYDKAVDFSGHHDRAKDELVLLHVVSQIKRMKTHAQSGLEGVAADLRAALLLDNLDDIKSELRWQIKWLDHYSHRLEYLEAHKIHPWDQDKFTEFCNKFKPVDTEGEVGDDA